jgi:capsular exopolysaccharide synthesis family protein
MLPVFEARTTIFVATPPGGDVSAGGSQIGQLTTGNTFSQARVKSYAAIVNNKETLDPVIEELKLKYSPEQLASNVRAVSIADTVLIEISVRDGDPNLASAIANSVAKNFSNTVTLIELNTKRGNSDLINVSIVKAAVLNPDPVYPRKAFNYLLGIFFGGLVGFGLALLLRILDSSMKNEQDLGDTPLFGVVSFDPLAKSNPLTVKMDAYSSRVEAYRVIRTNVLHYLEKSKKKSFVVTSCFAGEGKTTSSLNIAFAVAQAGFKVLVLEADMRRPSFKDHYNELGIPIKISKTRSSGLSALLTQKSKVITKKDCLRAVTSTNISNLWVLEAGPTPKNPAELLGSDKLLTIMDKLESLYDCIIIDTPPLLAVADATIVARKVQQVLLIAHAGETSKRNFNASKSALHDVDVVLAGVILNKVPKYKRGEVYGYTYSARGSDYYRYSYDYDLSHPNSTYNLPVKRKIKLPNLKIIFEKKKKNDYEVDDFFLNFKN